MGRNAVLARMSRQMALQQRFVRRKKTNYLWKLRRVFTTCGHHNVMKVEIQVNSNVLNKYQKQDTSRNRILGQAILTITSQPSYSKYIQLQNFIISSSKLRQKSILRTWEIQGDFPCRYNIQTIDFQNFFL